MTRYAILLPLMLAACQQAPAPANDANAVAEEVIVETETGDAATNAGATPPSAETPAPEPAPIPAKFRGIWAESRAVCSQLSHHSRLIISGSTLRYPSFVLVADSVDFPTDASLAVKGHNKRTQAPIEAHFSIDATGNILTDEAGGGAVRVNCP